MQLTTWSTTVFDFSQEAEITAFQKTDTLCLQVTLSQFTSACQNTQVSPNPPHCSVAEGNSSKTIIQDTKYKESALSSFPIQVSSLDWTGSLTEDAYPIYKMLEWWWSAWVVAAQGVHSFLRFVARRVSTLNEPGNMPSTKERLQYFCCFLCQHGSVLGWFLEECFLDYTYPLISHPPLTMLTTATSTAFSQLVI